jgi:hypothetical protein
VAGGGSAIKLVVSLLLLAFRLLYVDMRTKEYRTRHPPRPVPSCVRGISDGKSLGSTIDSRNVEFFIQAMMSL